MSAARGTVFLVDDDASVRRALSRLLRLAGFHALEFESPAAFLAADRAVDGPACAVFDVEMPGASGLELQNELAASRDVLPVIFITGHGDIPTSVRAMKAGAVDFLTKPVLEKDLIDAVTRAVGLSASTREARSTLIELKHRYESLTPREREVMIKVVQGLLNKQIAVELGTVEKTIKVHRARVMEKMGAQSLPDLVRTAERLGVRS